MSDFEKGREAGYRWGKDEATRVELERFNAFRWGAISHLSASGGFADWFDAEVLPPYTHAGFIASLTDDAGHDVESVNPEEAAVSLFGEENVDSPAFLSGFVEGVCSVLWSWNKLNARFAVDN